MRNNTHDIDYGFYTIVDICVYVYYIYIFNYSPLQEELELLQNVYFEDIEIVSME